MTDAIQPAMQPIIEIPKKPFFTSWTIIFNVLSGIVIILNQISPFTGIFFKDPDTAKNVSDIIGAFIVLVNIILRFKTNIGLKMGIKIVKT